MSPRETLARASETQIHRSIVSYFNLALDPSVIFFHPANGGYRRRTEAAIFAGLGLRAGVADLILFYRTDHPRILCIEVKSDGGRTSESQYVFAAKCAWLGIPYETVRSLDDAVEIVKRHGVPRRGDADRARAA